MQLGVRAPTGGSCAGPVTVVSPPATTYGFIAHMEDEQRVSVGEGRRLERLSSLSVSQKCDPDYGTASRVSANYEWESLVRESDLQLHRACGVLQQADGLRVAHAFGRCSADADDAVADLQESQTVYTHGEPR